MSSYHRNIHPCTKCEQSFESVKLLRSHMRWSHFESEACKFCNKLLYNIVGLYHHERICTQANVGDELPELCPECGLGFRNVAILRKHVEKHHFKAIACEQCGEVYDSAIKFKRHKRFHQNPEKFTCDLCGKRFQKARSMKVSDSHWNRWIRDIKNISHSRYRITEHCTLANSGTFAMCARNRFAIMAITFRTVGRPIRALISQQSRWSASATIAVAGRFFCGTLRTAGAVTHSNVMSLQVCCEIRTFESYEKTYAGRVSATEQQTTGGLQRNAIAQLFRKGRSFWVPIMVGSWA